jgi:hypothetical protein|tara:strand:+ start:167 stop:334 length:168 start_codon:yes stop_codon:yes gene_type:complete
MTRVRIILTLKVDHEEYPIPADGNLGAEIEDYLKDIIHEVDGLKITNLRITTEEI